jgi:hypothetical protein
LKYKKSSDNKRENYTSEQKSILKQKKIMEELVNVFLSAEQVAEPYAKLTIRRHPVKEQNYSPNYRTERKRTRKQRTPKKRI